MGYTLLIVESPAKCAKIESYLGANYKCMASFGHIRQLDLLKGFDPVFSVSESKRNQVAKLRTAIKKAGEVILATDDDREGEAIAWHLCDVFELPVETTKRIKFHEITKPALEHAVCHPTVLDMDLVRAQQARQVLDRLVGFQVSPTLWKHVSSKQGLSAGRCQTPALRLLYENHQAVEASEGTQRYTTTGYFTSLVLPFELDHHHTEEDAMADFLETTANHAHVYHKAAPAPKTCAPPQPFSTSGLQQAASNELQLSPKRTMELCQKLYEGGYITYMRTESVEYSGEFKAAAGDFIERSYGADYVVPTAGGGEAEDEEKELPHEAIRPTNIALEEALDGKECRLYKLIRRNTLESLMPAAELLVLRATVDGADGHTYKHAAEKFVFDGWRVVQGRACDERAYGHLAQLAEGGNLEYKKVTSQTSIVGTKAHYTEARLVKLLEDRGIGRPSTFASLVEKNLERGYVKKANLPGKSVECVEFELTDEAELVEHSTTKTFGAERGKLVIEPLGILVAEFLEKQFGPLFEYEYTSRMEDELDQIAKGAREWRTLCATCQATLDKLTEGVAEEKRVQFKLDEEHTYLIGKHGPVIKRTDKKGKTSFISVRQDVDMERLQAGEYGVEDIVERQNSLGHHEGKPMLLKHGKWGDYVLWGDERVNVGALDAVTAATVIPLLGQTRTIDKHTSVRKGKHGDYIYHKTPQMKKPRFISLKGFEGDVRACQVNQVAEFVKAAI